MHGLQFNASYTYSHSIDDNSRTDQGVIVQDSTNISNSRGSSDFDVRHRFVANAIYDLPFHGNRLVSGWEFAPILTLQSGNPFNVILSTANITGTGNTIRPNLIGPVHITGNPAQWISNPTATFSAPTNAFGNLGRNAIYGPGFSNLDLALIKNTKITERVSAQFRVDTFDVFNHPNFGQPSLTFPSATFSSITSTRFPTADSGSSRQLQFALKLQF